MSIKVFAPVPARLAAEQTPPERDRVVDLARAAALLVVVAGHSIMAVVAWPGGVPKLGNLLAAYPWTQLLTWALQIMPLFFFAGGAANALSYDRHRARGGTYAAWLWARADRLLRPALVYLAIMGLVAVVVTLVAPADVAAPLMELTTQLLWFLGAYLLVTALTPWFRTTTPARGGLVTLGIVALSAAIDVGVLLLGLPGFLALSSFVIVWAVPAYIGSLRAHGVLDRVPRAALVGVVVAGLAVNVALIAYGPWPMSMVGMPGDVVSNMAPPTVVLAIHSVILCCLVTLFDSALRRLAEVPRVWRLVTAVNLAAMTLYLWHLPMLISVTVLGHALHLERPTTIDGTGWPVPDGWGYLLGCLVFWTVYGVAVWAIVRLMWPFEHAPLWWWDSPPRLPAPSPRVASVVACLGTVAVGVSGLVLSACGLAGFPTRVVMYAGIPLSAAAGMVLLLAGGAAIRWAGASRTSAQRPTVAA
jgi:hypothetical protein